MERTPNGTAVGVDDPYAHVDRCDHLTDDGRCRFALQYAAEDRSFATERERDGFRCHVGEDRRWQECAHFRSRQRTDHCERCGLNERRLNHTEFAQPLLEEHHLSYAEGPGTHEITVTLCRWCHAQVHDSWARITDDVSPPPEAIAEQERRRGIELKEASFQTAADRQSQQSPHSHTFSRQRTKRDS